MSFCCLLQLLHAAANVVTVSVETADVVDVVCVNM